MGIVATPPEGLLDPFSRCLNAESAQRLADFRVDPAIQSRIDVLAERAHDGLLSEDERTEYESLVNAADLNFNPKTQSHAAPESGSQLEVDAATLAGAGSETIIKAVNGLVH